LTKPAPGHYRVRLRLVVLIDAPFTILIKDFVYIRIQPHLRVLAIGSSQDLLRNSIDRGLG